MEQSSCMCVYSLIQALCQGCEHPCANVLFVIILRLVFITFTNIALSVNRTSSLYVCDLNEDLYFYVNIVSSTILFFITTSFYCLVIFLYLLLDLLFRKNSQVKFNPD